MVFVVDEKPHATFRRDGNDLVMTAVSRAWAPRCVHQAAIRAFLGAVNPWVPWKLTGGHAGAFFGTRADLAAAACGGCSAARPPPVANLLAPDTRTLNPTPLARPPQHLSLADALCGSDLQVKTLDGRTLDVPITNVITPGSAKVIRWVERQAGLQGTRAGRA